MSYRLSTTDNRRALAVCRAQPAISEVRERNGQISFTAEERAVAELSQALIEAGALITALAPQGATLEELFFSLTEDAEVSASRGQADQAAEPVEAGR
jgi:ABC-2 type transport system ATP-binding protein